MPKINIYKKLLALALLLSLFISVFVGWLIFVNTSRVSFSDVPDFISLDAYHNLYKTYFPTEIILGLVVFMFVILIPIFYMVIWHVKNDKRYLFYVVLPNGFVLLLVLIDGVINIGFFKNSFLVIILMGFIFFLSINYYVKIWKQRLVKKMIEKIPDLKIPAKTAKNVGIGFMIVCFFFSGLILFVWFAVLFDKNFGYDPYPLIAFAFVMIFYAFIWPLFTGLIFYEQYKILSDKKYADYKPPSNHEFFNGF